MKTEAEPRLVFLTGAPLSSSLQWEEDVLSAPLQECFAEIPSKQKSIASSINSPEPVWRSLPFDREHLPTGFTQLTRPDDSIMEYNDLMDEDSFLTSMEISRTLSNEDSSQLSTNANPNEDKLSQYYEHSYAVHEDASFAHTIDLDSDNENSLSTSFEECSISFETNPTPTTPQNQLTKTRLASSPLTDLNRIPNASYLHSITPQTMTVNLVVGIISIPPPRLITTRRRGQTVELVEILVGDNTAAGFQINFWLPPTSSNKNNNNNSPPPSHLQSALTRLRPREIVLARNIALSSYKGKVYGQSLRKDLTTIDLLYRDLADVGDVRGAFGVRDFRNDGDGDVVGGDEMQLAKVGRVRRWVMDFVGVGVGIFPDQRHNGNWGGGGSRGGGSKVQRLVDLPPDTPS